MNKTSIGLIIGLMSLALLGSIWLQANWILSSIQLNEQQFDKLTMDALTAVADRLEDAEQREAFNYMNGYSTIYYEKEVNTKAGERRIQFDFSYKEYAALDNDAVSDDDNDCNCDKCVNERLVKYSKLMRFNEQINQVPLSERIFSLEMLSAFLKKELTRRGIDTEFTYGVFSNRKNSFIIVEDHYVVEHQSRHAAQFGHKDLTDSKYKVELFGRSGSSPGLLMIYFPHKVEFVLGSVLQSFWAALFFTLLIIGCFGYTISVIFRQKKLSEMKGDFINNMTHEFKTPIATISLATDSITNPSILKDPGKVRRFADIIRQENRRMNSQVEKVLQMALIDKRDFNLNLQGVDLHQVIETAVDNFALQVEKRQGILKTNLRAEKTMVEGDITHITNIIHNLMDNANKYSPEKPEITLHSRNLRNGVEITVEDKGIGMNREALKNIFDKFYRVHTGNLHDVKGFGLGLSYVKAIITAHKGQIDVKSEPGKGSRFILFFPFRVSE